MDVWLDIENPPQVQYIVPFKNAFESAGASVLVTARDHTITVDLLRSRGVDFYEIGSAFGRRKLQKVYGLLNRSRQLLALLEKVGRPRLVLATSRPAAIVARRLGIPSFFISDYEYANKSVFRLAGSYLLYPDVIPAEAFLRGGIRPTHLIPFDGLKEDLTFAEIDTEGTAAHDFGVNGGRATVLFRPPAEESHYYRRGSRTLALDVLNHLSQREDVVVVFTPRYTWQTEYLSAQRWTNEPIVLRQPVPFVPLLKGVDAVVASGGTMIREAAYLGIPAFSILVGEIGGVDRYLESIGRLDVLASQEDVAGMGFQPGARRAPIERNRGLLPELVQLMLEKAVPGRGLG